MFPGERDSIRRRRCNVLIANQIVGKTLSEGLMVIKVVFTLMAPIVGLLLGFVLVIVLLVVLANACSNG